MQSRTLLSLGVGLVVLVLPVLVLILIVVLMVDSSPELALPTAIIGLPIGLLLVGMLLFGLLVSPVPVLTVLGSRLTKRRRSALFGYLVGLLVWGLLLAIPAVRGFVTVLVALLGLGAWTLGLIDARGRYHWALWPPGKHRKTPAGEVPMAEQPELTADPAPGDEGQWPQEEIGEPFDPEALTLPFEES